MCQLPVLVCPASQPGLAAMSLQRQVGVLQAIWGSSRGNSGEHAANLQEPKVHFKNKHKLACVDDTNSRDWWKCFNAAWNFNWKRKRSNDWCSWNTPVNKTYTPDTLCLPLWFASPHKNLDKSIYQIRMIQEMKENFWVAKLNFILLMVNLSSAQDRADFEVFEILMMTLFLLWIKCFSGLWRSHQCLSLTFKGPVHINDKSLVVQ